MRPILLASLLIAAVLAGCAEDPTSPDASEDEEKFEEVEVSDDTGAIRGLVLTPTIVPIEGATVTATPGGLTTTTNVDGAFTFGDLEPGTYFLEATKLGFNKTQSSVQVVAGDDRPDIVKLVLPENPSALPFTELRQWDGYLQCGAGLGPAGSTNPCAVADSDNVRVFEAGGGPVDLVQIEMVWEGTNVFGDSLSVGLLRPGTLSNFAGADSASPAIFQVGGEQMIEELGDDYTEYTARVFPGTNNGEGVSVVLEQRFTVFATNFYGFEPDEGWSFVEDGPHPVPR